MNARGGSMKGWLTPPTIPKMKIATMSKITKSKAKTNTKPGFSKQAPKTPSRPENSWGVKKKEELKDDKLKEEKKNNLPMTAQMMKRIPCLKSTPLSMFSFPSRRTKVPMMQTRPRSRPPMRLINPMVKGPAFKKSSWLTVNEAEDDGDMALNKGSTSLYTPWGGSNSRSCRGLDTCTLWRLFGFEARIIKS